MAPAFRRQQVENALDHHRERSSLTECLEWLPQRAGKRLPQGPLGTQFKSVSEDRSTKELATRISAERLLAGRLEPRSPNWEGNVEGDKDALVICRFKSGRRGSLSASHWSVQLSLLR